MCLVLMVYFDMVDEGLSAACHQVMEKNLLMVIAGSSTSYTISPAITRESAPQLLIFFERGSYVPYLQDF